MKLALKFEPLFEDGVVSHVFKASLMTKPEQYFNNFDCLHFVQYCTRRVSRTLLSRPICQCTPPKDHGIPLKLKVDTKAAIQGLYLPLGALELLESLALLNCPGLFRIGTSSLAAPRSTS